MLKTLLSNFLLCLTLVAAAQPAQKNQSALTIDQIMQGEKFVGYLPENIRWSEDSKTVYFSWNPDNDTLRNTFKISLDENGGPMQPEKVLPTELMAMTAPGSMNQEKTLIAYAKHGDLFLYDNATHTKRQLTNTLEREANPVFSGDGKRVIFEKDNNLYSWEMGTGAMAQLTDFKKGFEKKDPFKSPQDQWLEKDQLAYFGILSQRKMIEETEKRRTKALAPKRPKTYHFGEKTISNTALSPDDRFITFRLTESGKTEQTEVPNYVTNSGKVENIRARAKVGAPVDATELGIYDTATDSIYFVDPAQIPGIYDKPAFLKEYWKQKEPYEDKYKAPRPVVFMGPVFSNDGKALICVRSQDNKDRWLLLLDLPTAKLRLLDHQHDDAWIGGPGVGGWNESMGNLGWLPDNRHIWFQSEETGFSHLYLLDVESGKKKPLTSGKFEILNAQLSRDEKSFFITSNKETPFEQHFYKMPVEGGDMERITYQPGNHETSLSPDEQWLAVRYSFSNKPWELYIMPNRAGATMQQVTVSTTDGFRSYKWREPDLVWFTAADGIKVPARLYRPAASARNGAAVIFVHGAGYLQNVHSWWSSYYREFMFHNILADNGFTVLDIDYRGSSGYGRDWRTAIYRHMGGKDLSDQVDGARYLSEMHGIDPHRIGIYGGSYGGFITLMAQFTAPGIFKSGAALRSVTDWAHYNHGYTANILNTPVEDSIAFRRSSPIYHAEGLQDHLLILHGMIDDNVQFQDVVRLAQRLIELEKKNWEFAVFPLERHGFVEASSWADEYRRIYDLFWETLRE